MLRIVGYANVESPATIGRRAGQHDAIRAAIEAGYSLRQVAEAAGLSHVGVAKIVKRANG
jgi:hypothetical protein